MPSTGFYLFLPDIIGGRNMTKQVSMPSTGFYLFLHWYLILVIPFSKQCQCPQRASTYFFYHSGWSKYRNQLCQCPQRASTYFFEDAETQMTALGNGVNALNGLLLISSYKRSITITDNNEVCQCPQRASTYFFRTLFIWAWKRWMCQCPQRASTYFFELAEQLQVSQSCVNALNGLLLISSKVKMFIPELVYVSMPSTGFYLFLQYPPRTLDFTEFWRGFLKVINWIFCQLIFSIVFLCLRCGRNMYTHL